MYCRFREGHNFRFRRFFIQEEQGLGFFFFGAIVLIIVVALKLIICELTICISILTSYNIIIRKKENHE